MGTTAQKLTYLNNTKSLLKDSINSLGGEITSQTTFRNYATELDSIYSNLPKVSGTGSSISLTPTLKGRLGSVLKGNTLQNGTPTPDNPIEIQSATGLQTITVSNGNNSQIKQLNLGNIKLKKSQDGAYSDYIQGLPDNWSIKRQIGSIVLDGTGSYGNDGLVSTVRRYTLPLTNVKLNDNTNPKLSNYFKYVFNYNLDEPHFYITNSGTLYIFSNYTDGTQFKNWLSTAKPEFEYPLATETTEAITNQEIINQLNEIYNLQSYTGTTNITITSEDLELIMTASALKGE